jgi:hypothetical protein
MTDFNKYKNISIKLDTYAKIDKISKVLVPDDPKISRAQVVTILVNKEAKKTKRKTKITIGDRKYEIHSNKKVKVHGASS